MRNSGNGWRQLQLHLLRLLFLHLPKCLHLNLLSNQKLRQMKTKERGTLWWGRRQVGGEQLTLVEELKRGTVTLRKTTLQPDFARKTVCAIFLHFQNIKLCALSIQKLSLFVLCKDLTFQKRKVKQITLTQISWPAGTIMVPFLFCSQYPELCTIQTKTIVTKIKKIELSQFLAAGSRYRPAWHPCERSCWIQVRWSKSRLGWLWKENESFLTIIVKNWVTLIKSKWIRNVWKRVLISWHRKLTIKSGQLLLIRATIEYWGYERDINEFKAHNKIRQLLLIRANIEVSSDEDNDYSDEVNCE